MAKKETQSASLKEAELTCRRLDLEAKESAEKAARVEAKRNAVHHEAAMAKLQIEGPLIPEHRWSLSLPGFNVP